MSKLIPPQDPQNNNKNNSPPLPPIPDLPPELVGKSIAYQKLPFNFKADVSLIRSELPDLLELIKGDDQRKIIIDGVCHNFSFLLYDTHKEISKRFELIKRGRAINYELDKIRELEKYYRWLVKMFNTLVKAYRNIFKCPDHLNLATQHILNDSNNYALNAKYSCDYFFIFLIEFIHFIDFTNINKGKNSKNAPYQSLIIFSEILDKEILYSEDHITSNRVGIFFEQLSQEQEKYIKIFKIFRAKLNKRESLCFAYTLRQTRILEIDNFLNYHRERHEGDNFCGLIEAAVKEHRELVNDFQFEKVMSWVEMNRTAPVIFDTELFFDDKSEGVDKTDLIRIIHGIHGLKWIKYEDGKLASLQKITDAFSRMFNVNLSNHSSLFSYSLDNSEQSNIEVFEDMKSIILEKRRKKGEKD